MRKAISLLLLIAVVAGTGILSGCEAGPPKDNSNVKTPPPPPPPGGSAKR
jgi:hypothetical protein